MDKIYTILLDLYHEYNNKSINIFDTIMIELSKRVEESNLDIESYKDILYSPLVSKNYNKIDCGINHIAYSDLGGMCMLNDSYKGVLLEGVVKISIDHLYTSVIKNLVELDLLIVPKKFTDIFLLIYYCMHRDQSEFDNNIPSSLRSDFITFYRTWMNMVYSSIHKMSSDKIGSEYNQPMVLLYSKEIINEIKRDMDFIYIDTDIMYVKSLDLDRLDRVMDKYGLTYQMNNIQYFNILSHKRYVYVNESSNDIRRVGRRRNRVADLDMAEFGIKMRIRDNNIVNILSE